MAKLVGTVNSASGLIIAVSWHLRPCKVKDPEVIFGITSGAVYHPAVVTVWGDYDPEVDYTTISDWSVFQSAVTQSTSDSTLVLTGNIIDRRECWNKQAVSIPIPENVSLITVTVEGPEITTDDTATYELILACRET